MFFFVQVDQNFLLSLVENLGKRGKADCSHLRKSWFDTLEKNWFDTLKKRSELAKPDWEPVENLSNGDKTDPEAKSADAAKARNEVQPGHLWRPFKFCNRKLHGLVWTCGMSNLPNTVESPKKMFIKDVHDGNVLFISIVRHLVLIKRLVRSRVWWISIN